MAANRRSITVEGFVDTYVDVDVQVEDVLKALDEETLAQHGLMRGGSVEAGGTCPECHHLTRRHDRNVCLDLDCHCHYPSMVNRAALVEAAS